MYSFNDFKYNIYSADVLKVVLWNPLNVCQMCSVG